MESLNNTYIKFLKFRYLLIKFLTLGFFEPKQKFPKFNIGDQVTTLVDSYFLRTSKKYTIYAIFPNKSFSWTVGLNETMALVDERDLVKIN